MTTRVPRIMPTLAGARWADVDLNALSRHARPAGTPNVLLDPEACARFVEDAASLAGADLTYGGWGEDRSHLWEGHYLPPGGAVHLGVDVNAPAGTQVTAPVNCRVVLSRADRDRNGGWGGLVVMALDAPFGRATHLVYGHLAHAGLPAEGTAFGAGDAVGMLGIAAENGGWFPHLHVQCLSREVVERHGPGYASLDGYGTRDDLAAYPDPTGLVMG